MEKNDKPRLAKVLGVNIGQKFRVVCPEEGINSVEVWLNEKGHLIGVKDVVCSAILCAAINYPESIIRTRHLTEPELAICKALGARWVSIGPCSDFIMLTKTKPTWDGECNDWLLGKESVLKDDPIARIRKTLFPSVHPGDCICAEEEIRSGD